MAPLIVITGPTASGKTSLAVRLAKRWNGEIICADSRTVYKEMNVGTAKPTTEQQDGVKHWMLDVATPGKRFTAVDFQRGALQAISAIRANGKIPFLVGGSGLYIDAVTHGYSFGSDADFKLRENLEMMTTAQLKILLLKQHKSLPENSENRRYLIRRIENNNTSVSVKKPSDANTHVIAIQVEKDVLRQRISARIDEMFAAKIVQETQHLLNTYDATGEAFTGNIYRIVRRMLEGELTEIEAKELSKIKDWQLAKRQITWLKRHDYVRWLSAEAAEVWIDTLLQKVTTEQFSGTIESKQEGLHRDYD